MLRGHNLKKTKSESGMIRALVARFMVARARILRSDLMPRFIVGVRETAYYLITVEAPDKAAAEVHTMVCLDGRIIVPNASEREVLGIRPTQAGSYNERRAQMPKFTVVIQETITYYVPIEALNEDVAKGRALAQVEVGILGSEDVKRAIVDVWHT